MRNTTVTAYHLSSLAAMARDSLRLERESTHPCKRAHFGPHWHGRLLKEKGIPPLHAHHPTSCNQKPSMTSAPRGLNPSRIRQNVPRFKKCGMILIRVWAHGRCAETTGMLLVPVWAGVTQQFFFKPVTESTSQNFLRGQRNKQKKGRQRLCPQHHSLRAEKATVRQASMSSSSHQILHH